MDDTPLTDPPPDAGSSAGPLRLLVIEDDPDDVLLLRRALADAGEGRFRAEVVARFSDGLAALADGEYDVIVLDLSLPDSRGPEGCERLRTAAPRVPIVVVTGLDDEATAIEVLRRGAQDYIIKGWSDGRMVGRVLRYAVERARLKDTAAASLDVLRAEHAERQRISQEIHDGVCQILSSANFRLRALVERLERTDPKGRESAERAATLVGGAIDEIRRISRNLRPAVLNDFGLLPALRGLLRDFRETTGARFRLQAKALPRLPPETEFAVYRILQEAMSNAARHAKAKSVQVSLRAVGATLAARVSDDGKGMSPAGPNAPDRAGSGLANMKNRASLLGGTLEVRSSPGRGTDVVLRLPLPNKSD